MKSPHKSPIVTMYAHWTSRLMSCTVCRENRCSFLHDIVRKYQTKCGGLCTYACFKFPGLCFCQKL